MQKINLQIAAFAARPQISVPEPSPKRVSIPHAKGACNVKAQTKSAIKKLRLFLTHLEMLKKTGQQETPFYKRWAPKAPDLVKEVYDLKRSK